jgi:hypothetical protein
MWPLRSDIDTVEGEVVSLSSEQPPKGNELRQWCQKFPLTIPGPFIPPDPTFPAFLPLSGLPLPATAAYSFW